MRPTSTSPAVISAELSPYAFGPESLNSERIEERFGSYGIDVLLHETGMRRSSLHSLEGDKRICRTYAVVQFHDESTSGVAEAHADVLAGHSIGATFKSTGWQVRKVTLHIGSISLNASNHVVGELMHLDGEVDIGMHAYRLVLEKESRSINYATIVETHHPDYVTVAELHNLYGENYADNLNDDEVERLAKLVLQSD